ncbi:MAG: dipeptidyl-peptidase 7, Serine peptidase family [Chitinophagaceae bacterium]|nr:dipeptidyl-peptidase 7, Serine peptidase family [Chitinophagaceae bacterium]
MKQILIILFALSVLINHCSFADEGMWLPHLINRNMKELEKLGCKLTAEDIYSINKSSLKDVVVNFGNFCTGEMISAEGLLLTNHHCGFSSVQTHSSVQKNYIANGFWAMNKSEELPNAGLTVTFLVRVEDVSSNYFNNGILVNNIDSVSDVLQRNAIRGTHYTAEVKSFYERNAFYLFVNETYKDVRLVGVPPSAIGKFGGDTDNWMWPRHTGDFCLFRVYAGTDGKPADYSPNNVPLQPRHHLPISLKGIRQNDFAMVMGFSGNTERYLNSQGILLAYNQSNPTKIKIREQKLAILAAAMKQDPAIRIQYASKYARISNYYKYFIGQNKGLKALNVAARKEEDEASFYRWVNADEQRKKKYGTLNEGYEKAYHTYEKINVPYVYFEEGFFGIDVFLEAYKASSALSAFISTGDVAAVQKYKPSAEKYYKDFDKATEKKVFIALLQSYKDGIPESLQSSFFTTTLVKKYKNNMSKYADDVFSKSIFTDQNRMNAFLNNPQISVLEKDPAFQTMQVTLDEFRAKLGPYLGQVYGQLDDLNHVYMEAYLEWKKSGLHYPDANFSMRLTYGSVKDYNAKDAVHYLHQTHLQGIMEKEDSLNDDFIVPGKLQHLYANKDFGNYADSTGNIPVCFITNNDITGGNSGSPVINARGELIGCAFDGNWEAMSGDLVFEPKLQRCIAVDVRYILFIIDKYAGANYLLKEMTLK